MTKEEVHKIASRIAHVNVNVVIDALTPLDDEQFGLVIRCYAELKYDEFSKSKAYLVPPTVEMIENSAWKLLAGDRSRHV